MFRRFRTLGFVIGFLLWAGPARAAPPRVVVMPVVVGAGQEPPADLMASMTKGLQENATWNVLQGEELAVLYETSAGLSAEARTRLTGRLAEAKDKIHANALPEAMAILHEIRAAVVKAVQLGHLAHEDFDLAWRASALAVAVLVKNSQPDQAKVAAQEAALAFPGRKAGVSDDLPPGAIELLAAPSTTLGVKLTIKTRPAACDVVVNGAQVGRAPLELRALPRVPYQAEATCPVTKGRLVSHPQRIVVDEKETAREELLDAEFERGFRAEGGHRVRFASSHERRELEDTYARRIGERFGAQIIVLASVGELSGTEWLNGRLYGRSGSLNRQGLVRAEGTRALALGRYLGGREDIAGVLRPEQAGVLATASQSAPKAAPESQPWYTDVVGWSLVGSGIAGMSLGLWANAVGDRKTRDGDDIRGDFETQQRYYREAQRARFLGGIGVVGGALTMVTGVVLLIIPEYASNEDAFTAGMTPLPEGGGVSVRGRF